MTGRLDGRVVLITGAAKGIGEGIARRYAQEGATLVIVDRDQELGQATTTGIADEFGVKATFLRANVGYEDEICPVVKEAGETHGRLDVLVNNAQGFNGLAPLLEKTTGEF